MNRSVRASLAFLLLVPWFVACYAQDRGPCEFVRPEGVVEIDHHAVTFNILRKGSDPINLVLVDDHDDERHLVRVLKLDFKSGSATPETIPFRGYGSENPEPWPPPGYTEFVSGAVLRDQHPLIRSGMLRYENVGKTVTQRVIGRGEAGLTTGEIKRFTGMRRLMYGRRPLVEQSLVNVESLRHIADHVQIEPDGDRILCMCDDGQVKIALFSRKKLDAELKTRAKD